MPRCGPAATSPWATARGAPLPTCQWYHNGSPISNATSSSCSIPTVTASHAGSYTVVVSNSAGSATSATATLTVNTPIVITASPTDQTLCAGQPATFSVTAI